ncbi:unnamed protein product, partial [Adineta steineri]
DEHIKQSSKQSDHRAIETPTDQIIHNHNNEQSTNITETTPTISNQTLETVDGQQTHEKINKISSLTSLRALKRPMSPIKSINTSDISIQKKFDDNLHRERNTLVVLGCLAEKLVGPTSASILDTIAL